MDCAAWMTSSPVPRSAVRPASRLRVAQSALSRHGRGRRRTGPSSCSIGSVERLVLQDCGWMTSFSANAVVCLAGSMASANDRGLRRGDGGVPEARRSGARDGKRLVDVPPPIRAALSQCADRSSPKPLVAAARLLERGEVHIGRSGTIRAIHASTAFMLPPDEVFAALRPISSLPEGGAVDIVRLTGSPLLLLDPGYSIQRFFDATCPARACGSRCSLRAARRTPAGAGQRPGRVSQSSRRYSGPDRHRLHILRVTQGVGAARGGLPRAVGRAPHNAAYCSELLRGTCRAYARGTADHAAIENNRTSHARSP